MNLLTFDVEDWFHILEHDATRSEAEWVKFPTRIHDSVDLILDLLSQNNAKATFFCLGWIAERYPDVIKQIDSMGHEVGSHSHSHQLVSDLTSSEVQQDIGRSVEILEDLTGKKVKYYRAPGFSITRKTPWIIDILQKYGIEIDCSICPANHSHGGDSSFTCNIPQLISYKGAVLKELPLNVWDIHGLKVPFSGGGYFRLFPYWLISRLIQDSDYVMTYFHPRDFDPDQPVIPDLAWSRKFKSYYGLSTSYNKLSNLLRDHEFSRVSEIDRITDWDSVPVLDLG